MKKHTITDELLRELHSEADFDLREKIEKEVPGLIGLEIGKWYKKTDDWINWLMCFQSTAEDINYGFNSSNIWGDQYCIKEVSGWNPATDEEVKAALIGEAKKRGFVKGVHIVSPDGVDRNFQLEGSKLSYAKETQTLYCTISGVNVYYNGVWATIIEQPKPSLSEAIAEYEKAHEKFLKILKNE